jgi:hypothetical protein
MHSLKTVSLPSALLALLLTGCASSPKVAPQMRPDVPSEVMTPAPPPGHFLATLEAILSRSQPKPKQSQTD